MKYYVYASNPKKKKITAALSFPNEETAEQVYMTASREVEGAETGKFEFGHTADSQVSADSEFALNSAAVRLRIDFTSLPPGSCGFRKGIIPYKVFDIRDFERAEEQTKKILTDSKYLQEDIQFMRYAILAMFEAGGDAVSVLDFGNKTDIEACLRITQEASGKKSQTEPIATAGGENTKAGKHPDAPKRGRKLKKRSEWVIAQHCNGRTAVEIFDTWNSMTHSRRKAIDPGEYKSSNPDSDEHTIRKNSDQFKDVSHVHRIIRDFKKNEKG